MIDNLVQLLSQHHAICVVGEGGHVRDSIAQAIEQVFEVPPQGHPDLYRYIESPLSIETARRIREEQARKPVLAARTLIVIETDHLPQASQNALLKTFEDPAQSTVFVLCLPHADGLLPTLRSRLALISLTDGSLAELGDQRQDTSRGVDAEIFLRASAPERIELLKPIIEAKDKTAARRLVDNCERVLAGLRAADGTLTRRSRDGLEIITKYKQYLDDPGSSLKLLLEYIALRL
ncbi:MAG: hypothetical protein WDZ82_01590 [Candidatus Paceibacterota bacterium]